MPDNRTVKHKKRIQAMREKAEARVAPVVVEKPAPKKKTTKAKAKGTKKK